MAKQTRKAGRPSVFRDKTERVQGFITTRGRERFEKRRGELADLVGMPVRLVSDGDVIEYLARGSAETVRYKEGKKIDD